MKITRSLFITTSLAIFSMLFGAGNLMFPIKTGLESGQHFIVGTIGFLLTAVFLPIVGIFSMVMFNGNYEKFFSRLGKIPGLIGVLYCMAIIGPVVAMPQIIALSYTMFTPFLPKISLLVFSLIFTGIIFIATFKENRLLDILGYFVSPALLLSLSVIIIKGVLTPNPIPHTDLSALSVFWHQLQYGYRTLDLLGGLFFASIVLNILRQNISQKEAPIKRLAMISLKTGTVGSLILAVVNIGIVCLGLLHGNGLGHVNEAQLFSLVSLNVVGQCGSAIVTLAVIMACFSTITALSVVVSEYVKTSVFKGKIPYVSALVAVLGLALITANFGLSNILAFSKPIVFIGYPALITLTFVNAMYKMFGFKPVKIPVFATLIISAVIYCW